MAGEISGGDGQVSDALTAVGGTEGLRGSLEGGAARDPSMAESLECAGGAELVAEALVVAFEALSSHEPVDADVAEAVQAAGGASVLVAALAATGPQSAAGEALEASAAPRPSALSSTGQYLSTTGE